MKANAHTANRISSERGAVTVIIAVTLGALLAIAALAIDAGMLYQERRQLQTAVDAAALAAAQEVAEGRASTAEAIAREYIAGNSESGITSVSVTYPAANQVRVSAGTSRELFFARTFGVDDVSLSAIASAGFGPAGALSDLVPFLVPSQYVAPHIGAGNGFSFELGSDRPMPDTTGQGGYFWLCDFADSGGGTSTFADWIINGYPGTVSIGAVVNGTGVKDALKGAINERMYENASMIIPVYDATENMGANGEYHVVGFAEFVVTGMQFQGNPKTITGYFTDGRVAASAGSGGTPGADFGIRTVWLID